MEIVGTVPEKIVTETVLLLVDPDLYRQMATEVDPYGDGKAAERILQAIRYYFKLGVQPVDEYKSSL